MAEKEYISREAAIEAMYELCNKDQRQIFTREQLLALDDVPAANVREVVLCKDCYAYRKDKELAEAAYLDGEKYCALLRCEMPEDGFCWYGKPNCGADMREEQT